MAGVGCGDDSGGSEGGETAGPPPSPGGPLALPDDFGTDGVFPVDVGEYAWGDVLVRNAGSMPAVVERVEVVRLENLTIIGMHALRLAELDELEGLGSGYSPAGVPVEGLEIPPGSKEGFQLVLGVRVERAGIGRHEGVRIHYRVGDRRYVATLDQRLTLCAPADRFDTEESCRGETR